MTKGKVSFAEGGEGGGVNECHYLGAVEGGEGEASSGSGCMAKLIPTTDSYHQSLAWPRPHLGGGGGGGRLIASVILQINQVMQ